MRSIYLIKMCQQMISGVSESQVELSNQSSSEMTSIIEKFNSIAELFQNARWCISVLVLIVAICGAVFLMRRKTVSYTEKEINRLKENGKYIPGLFVELNESKEILRFFVYGAKWKNRIIEKFNFLYSNVYGDILKNGCRNSTVRFNLNPLTSIDEIIEAVSGNIAFHEALKEKKNILDTAYKQSEYLFHYISSDYTRMLELLQKYALAANSRYCVLTGSAGNGKTNLLCSISELIIRTKQSVVFINSRDVESDLLEYYFNALKVPELLLKNKSIYLWLENRLLEVQRKYQYIIIDAINENDRSEFGKQVSCFINNLSKYSHIKFVVSCRNEYYSIRFKKDLVDGVIIKPFVYDLKEQNYSSSAIDRVIRTYREYFNYSGQISNSVRNALSENLLLLRIFFETHRNKSCSVYTIRKHEIFDKYIKEIKRNTNEHVYDLLDAIVDDMLNCNSFDNVNSAVLKNYGFTAEAVQKTVDGSLLISQKLLAHTGTIAQQEFEVVYFVFDELRDYYIARRIAIQNSSKDAVNGDAIIARIKRMHETGASCSEGVTYYTYIFFRTDASVINSGESERLCNMLLDFYRIPINRDLQSYYHRHHREEFQNLGLRIILTSGLELTEFETSYIQDCLRKDAYEDGGILFDTMLKGTLNYGLHDLDTFLNVVFGLRDKEAILNVLKQIRVRNYFYDNQIPEDLVKYHKQLISSEPDRAIQIQRVAELFLLCFKLNDKEEHERLTGYFYKLANHIVVQQEMIASLRHACNMEADEHV